MNCFIIPIVAIALSVPVYAEEPAMRSLFNGKDLTGWTGDGYKVENGSIVCTPEGKNLITDGIFSNYLLEFEFKLPPGGNNGLGIHHPGNDPVDSTGMELQILDNTDPKYGELKDAQFNGSLYLLAAAKKSGLKPVGEWNHERVSLLGSGLLVELNGEIILRANLDDVSSRNPTHQGAKRRAGRLALLGHGDAVAFRNIQIAEIPPAANIEGVLAAGFTRLFDGKSLAGWKPGDVPDWSVTNGILRFSGQHSEPTTLRTEKEFGDCTLVFDWRWSALTRPSAGGGAPGLRESHPLGSAIHLRGADGYQINLTNLPGGSGEATRSQGTSKTAAEPGPHTKPKTNADRPVGEWNRTMITIQGDSLSVSLNGRVVIENARCPGSPATGFVGIQGHHAAIDFANVWIKDL